MRSIKGILCTLLFFLGATLISAQSNPDVFTANYSVAQIYESPYGYRVILSGPDFSEREVLVPARWIYSDKVALLSFSRSKAAPYFQGYFDRQSGELDFFRLVVPHNRRSLVWAYDSEDGLAERFQSASLSDF